MRTALALPCIMALMLTAAAVEASEPEAFAEYLAGPEFRPIYLTELRRLAMEEGSLWALRDYAGALQDGGQIARSSAFAESVEVRGEKLEALTMLVRAEGSLRGGEYGRAVATLDSLTAAFPVKPALVEAQYLKARCLYELGRYKEARFHLAALRDEGSALRASVTYYLALCDEELGDTRAALEGFEVLHEAAFAPGTAGLIRCRLRTGDVDGATAAFREASDREIELPRDEILGLIDVTGWGAPELWRDLVASLAADTAYSPGPGIEQVLLDGLRRGEDVGRASADFLKRGRSDMLRYAGAMSLGDDAAAYDSLLAIASGRDPVQRGPFVMAMAAFAYGNRELAMPTQAQLDLVKAGPYWDEIALPNEIIHWLDMRVSGGQALDVSPVVADYSRDLEAGFDDLALFELARLLERAGDVQGALQIYDRVRASPVPSAAAFACEGRAHVLGITPPGEEDVSSVVEEVAAGDRSDLELAQVFEERLRDYGKAAEYYQRAAGRAGDPEERDRVRLRAGVAFSSDYLTTGNGASRDKALNIATALAASGAVKPGDLISLLKSSTDWLALDLFRSTEAARSLAGRADLDDGDLLELARILYRLYERGDAPAFDLCLSVLGRLLERETPAAAFERAALIDAMIRQRRGDYSEALERFDACRGKAEDSIVRRLCRMGMGDCYVGSGGLEEGLEQYRRAGDPPAVRLRRARCLHAMGRTREALDASRGVLGYYAPAHISIPARMLTALLSASGGRLPREAFTLYFHRYDFLGLSQEYRDCVRLLAAYDLALRGYEGLGRQVLENVPRTQLEGLHCQVFLSNYDAVAANLTDFYMALSDRLAPNCKDALDAYARMKLRAEFECASDNDQMCVRAGEGFMQRFPLAVAAADDIGSIRATSLYRDMYVGKADAIADSLFRKGIRSELLADAVYRKGVSFLVEKANQEAKQTFLIMKEHFPDSRLRQDVYFKLGTVYFLTGAYDSSASHFRLAADDGKVSLREDALFNLGLALEESGDLGAASEAFYELALAYPFSDRFERALLRSAYCLEKSDAPLEAREIYKTLLQYAAGPETRAETNFWLGECLAKAGRHVEAALEFIRTGYLYPGEEAWAGTARYRAGMECEAAGLRDAAMLIYEENVRTFGRESTWGEASFEKLENLAGEG